MFTGIITDIGRVAAIENKQDARRLVMHTAYDVAGIAIGASIAHDGCCLTVTDKGLDGMQGWYAVDVSSHTLAHTTLGNWQAGRKVNLERALRAGDELGGHMVSGHVDAVAHIHAMDAQPEARHYDVILPENFACYMADKGSVTLDGTSLTVTWVQGNHFGLTLIPHTLAVTTWGEKQAGDALNLEVDVLARYVKRMMESQIT